ncbi:unnamed protein product [Tilletia caries]|nr:unnamed protein product [Tilletia caries]
MSAAAAHTERPPTVTSIPPILVSQAQTIQGAYVNSGRMSEGLARLQSTKVMFQQAAKRNSTAAEQTEVAVSALLVAMQTDVRRRIKYSEARMSDELDGVKMRLRKEMACNHETIERHLQDTIKMVRSVMERTRDDAQGGLTDALDFLNNQLNALLEKIKQSPVLKEGTFDRTSALSDQSARVVADLKRVIEQIIKLGDSKNGDDKIQDFLYNSITG